MFRQVIERVINGGHLDESTAYGVMAGIMNGEATPAQIAALLVALRAKGETPDEVSGFARAIREKATPVRSRHTLLADTCGTGGDGANTFNISTAAAFVVAAAGVPVAKHGNNAVSSRCGSADVLKALGAVIDLDAAQVSRCLDTVGIAFLYAPRLNPAMRHAAGPRREIGIRTVFNLLGPLVNPANPAAQVVGVFSRAAGELVAHALAKGENKRAFVVHGAGGLDEISLAGPALIWQVEDGTVQKFTLDPATLGFPYTPNEALAGGSPEENAALLRNVLNGGTGALRDAVIINAALALVAAGSVSSMFEGVRWAGEVIDGGQAAKKLDDFVAFTREAGCAGA